jgi:hypothetical protein
MSGDMQVEISFSWTVNNLGKPLARRFAMRAPAPILPLADGEKETDEQAKDRKANEEARHAVELAVQNHHRLVGRPGPVLRALVEPSASWKDGAQDDEAIKGHAPEQEARKLAGAHYAKAVEKAAAPATILPPAPEPEHVEATHE